jgi:uncharacterized BrkB/YihY/UPF0761 family membrane protein
MAFGMTGPPNAPARIVARLDNAQRNNRRAGLLFGVVKKYGDDRGSTLAALLTYYGFMSLFPMLLVFTTIVGFVGGRDIENTLIGAALRQLPVYGPELRAGVAHSLGGSWLGLGFGLAALLYGALGVTQTAQFAMAQVWNVPGVIRPGFVPRLVRGVVFLLALTVGIIVTAGLGGVATAGGQLLVTRVGVLVAALLLNIALFAVTFRILTPTVTEMRRLRAGAIFGGTGYTALVTLGTALAQHQLDRARAVYGQFGIVLGLISWLYLVSQLTLYAAELNVVRDQHLWPRGIVAPLTEADRRVLHDIAHQEQRHPDQRVGVGFEPGAVSEVNADARATPTPP